MQNRIAVIGDIHGCLKTLKSLYIKLDKMCEEVYSVGDLVDRGRFSKEVVEFCLRKNIKCVRGNHEDMLLNTLDSQESFFNEDLEIYFRNGGDKTQYSYIESLKKKDFKIFREEFKDSEHYKWIKTFPLKIELDGLIISHAGIIEGGDDFSIIWNRSTPAKLGKMQVKGHTPHQEVDYIEDHYINIDTGCVFKNKLTAIIADKISGKVIEIIQEKFHKEDSFQIKKFFF